MNTLELARTTTLAALSATALVLNPSATAQTQPVDTTPSKHLEVIHHPNYDKTVFMPFVPAQLQNPRMRSSAEHGLAGGAFALGPPRQARSSLVVGG
jgi:hypothetical protein